MANQDWLDTLAGITPAGETGTAGASLTAAADAGTSAAPAQPVASEYHIAHNRFDEYLVGKARKTLSRLDSAITSASQVWPHAEALATDVYNALYKSEIETQPVDAEHKQNAKAIDEMLGTSDFKELRELTRLDDYASALSAATFTTKLVETLTKQQEEHAKRERERQQQRKQREQEERDEQEQEAEQGMPGMPGLPGAAGESGAGESGASGDEDGEGEGEGEQEERDGESEADREEREDREREESETRQALRVAARQAAEAARDAVDEANAALAALGGDDAEQRGWGEGASAGGTAGDMATRAKLAALVASNPRLQMMIKLAGPMKSIAKGAQRNRAEHTPDELHDVEIGDNVQYMLSSEVAYLADEDLELLWLAKYAEKALLQYELRGTAPQGEGPIVVCVDESGSMNNTLGMRGMPEATRRDWASAVVLAALMIARKQKRDLAVIHYAGWLSESNAADNDPRYKALHDFSGDPHKPALRTDVFVKGQATPDEIVACALHFWNGGNSDQVLDETLAVIQSSTFKKADVIMITDGKWNVRPEVLQRWQAVKKSRDFNCFGMVIGASGESFDALRTLQSFCDTVNYIAEPGTSDREALTQAFSV